MPKSNKAKSIAEKMGVMSITGDGACVKCHFTRHKAPDGKEQALSGVSCESCHGAAADWLDIHHDFGGDDKTRKTETLAHREQRMMAVDKAGMIRSERLYDVALNCYECHTIPNEKLINEAGHPTGSEFELVSRYQVEIRHNFFASDGEHNDPAPGGLNPLHHMREMYVIGRMLDLEMTLRALQKATKKGPYLDYLSGRVKSLEANLKEIQAKVAIDEVGKALAAIKDLDVKENNATAYLEAAKVVTNNGREFAWKMSGGELGALDSLIPKQYKGKDLPRISNTAGALGQGESIDRSNEGKEKKKE